MTATQKSESRDGDSSRWSRLIPPTLPAAACAAVLLATLAGCATAPEILPVCPGKPTVEAALETLKARAERAVSLRASGHAMLNYHVPDKEKPERHNLPMQIWFHPPIEIYIQGSIAVDPRAVMIGSNEQEFWLALRPKEMSSYYRGRWEEAEDFEGLLMSPRVVLEAFGIVVEPDEPLEPGLWTLRKEGPYDVLTQRNEAGRTAKRVHVYACDYLVHKIEYYDERGQVAAVAQFRDYEPVDGEFLVPTEMYVVATAPDGRKDTIDIDIRSVRRMDFSERQQAKIFAPPAGDRFENVYRYEQGRWVLE